MDAIKRILRVLDVIIHKGVFVKNVENVTISVFLSAPQLTTLPVRIFGYTDQAIETWLVAVCSIAIVFTVFLIWLIERILGLERIFYAGKA